MFKITATGGAVNEVTHVSAATGNTPRIAASGDDTNIHLDLRGKGNGLVKISVLEQDITTNAYNNNSVILTGWGYIVGNTSAASVSQTVTFGITFSALPVILTSFLAQVTGVPANIGAFNTTRTVITNITTIGGTSFSIILLTAGGGNFPDASNYGYSWLAIGTLN